MKKTNNNIGIDDFNINELSEDIPIEVDFSSAKSFSNSDLAKRLSIDKTLIIELEPDIAKYFKNSKQVNSYLREQINLIQHAIAS